MWGWRTAGIETYSHCMYGGLWSNMLFDDSVEEARVGPLPISAGAAWWSAAASGAGAQPGNCSVRGGNQAMNGNQSLLLGAGCTAVNRGLVVTSAETSMHFVGAQPYEGYVFLQGSSPGATATVRVSLLCSPLGKVDASLAAWTTLGTADLALGTGGAAADMVTVAGTEGDAGAGDGAWTMFNFTITPSKDCLHAGTGASQGQGAVSLSLVGGGGGSGKGDAGDTGVWVGADKMMVEPGEWGRYQGMHLRADLAETFLGQKPTMMRLGGSMTNADGFRFKYMVGPPWSRPPTDSSWIAKTSWVSLSLPVFAGCRQQHCTLPRVRFRRRPISACRLVDSPRDVQEPTAYPAVEVVMLF